MADYIRTVLLYRQCLDNDRVRGESVFFFFCDVTADELTPREITRHEGNITTIDENGNGTAGSPVSQNRICTVAQNIIFSTRFFCLLPIQLQLQFLFFFFRHFDVLVNN